MTTAATNAPRPKLIAFVVGLIAVTALMFHVRRYPVLTYDDAFISLRYTQRFLEGHGLTWTEGPPVEGYSNLLWVLGCALLAALGVDLLDTPVVLGIACAVAAIAALVYAFPARSWSRSLPGFAGAMFIALAGPIALWAVAGLEGCLVAALLAWSFVLLRPLVDGEAEDWKSALLPGIPLGLLCLSRPDAPLLVIIICAFLLLRSRSAAAAARAVAVGVVPGLATLGQLAFRLVYYDDWLPNTARAKVAFTAERLESGTQCVAGAGLSSYALWVPALLALYVAWRDAERRPRILLGFTLVAAWTAYTATVACQPYGFRMLIPSYVLLAFLVAEALDWVQGRGRSARVGAWLATLALLFLFGRSQQNEKNIVLAREQRPPVTVLASTIGNTLREAFAGRDPLLAVDAAGAIAYFSGLRSLDMLGLNDAHIARHRGESFGQGIQGHELGDGAYVLSQEPDIIVANRLGSGRLAFVGGRQMKADPRFRELYRRVQIHGEYPVPVDFHAFLLLEGRVGVQRSEGSVVIPGHLLADGKGARAELDDRKALGTRFTGDVEVTVDGIALDAGAWRFTSKGDGSFELAVRGRSEPSQVVRGAQSVELVLAQPELVDITVVASPRAFLTEVLAERTGD